MNNRLRSLLRYAVKAVLITIAVLYFLIDLVFLSVLRPLRRRFMELRLVQRMRAWVATLNRYWALLLLLVPWLILEPIKPIGFLLFAHKRHMAGVLLIGVGEIVKLTLFEQLFDMTKPKLMTFPWFAWCYGQWLAALAYLRSLPVFRRVRSWYRTMRAWIVQRLRSVRRAARDVASKSAKTREP